MTGSNPFADQPLPAAERLHSAADPLNPYAAPAGIEEYHPELGPGVGIWRNGKLVVIHQSLDFPERCIWTNEPSERRFTQQFTFSSMLGLRNWSIPFAYSFSPVSRNKVVWDFLSGGLLTTASFLMLVMLFALDENGILQVAWLSPLFFITLAFGFGIMWRQLQSPLSLTHQEQAYFCLRGAKEPFLRSLPNWPGLLK
jgi:hypothetical protein